LIFRQWVRPSFGLQSVEHRPLSMSANASYRPHSPNALPATPPASPTGGPLFEFFRYHGVWSPGIRLFRAITFHSKALVISAMFMLPLMLMGWFYLSSLSAQIAFTQKERAGVALMEEFVPVLKGVVDTRNATRAMLGTYDASRQYTLAREQTDAAMNRLLALLISSGDPLGLTEPAQKLKAAWDQTASAKNGVDDKGRTVFGPVPSAAVELLNQIGDQSNLVLDPDLDSFYLVNSLVLTLPKVMEDVGQLWGWGTFAIVRAGIGSDNEAKWHVWSSRLETGVADTRSYVARAVNANPELKQTLDLSALDAAMALRKSGHAAVFDANLPEAAAYYAKGEAAVAQIADIYKTWLPALDALLQARESRDQQARFVTLAFVSAGLAAALYLFISFGKVLDGGLREVAFHIDAMRDGDLTTRPRAWGADEVARLMHTLSEMQTSLRRIVSQVRNASDSIVHASGEIRGASMDLSGRTEQSAANLEETAAAMEEIAAIVRNNEATVGEATRLADTNAQAAERGGQIIGQVVKTMQDINGSSSRIGDIIGTIDGIAFQTNILALNAAVEAARAGEQGRGFAVVASEVRALAQRSASAAREIKTLITTSMEQVENGTRVVREAGTTIDDIVGSARQVRELLAEVANGAREQTAGIAQSAKAVQEMDTVTQQNAALVEQTAAAAGSLNDQAVGLAGEVSQFKLPA
jgi:methyl-accepting chemotaxis protein